MKNQTNGNGATSSKRQPKIDQASKRISMNGAATLSASATTAPANPVSQSAAPHRMAPNSVKGGQD
jgi:hypothetical protein